MLVGASLLHLIWQTPSSTSQPSSDDFLPVPPVLFWPQALVCVVSALGGYFPYLVSSCSSSKSDHPSLFFQKVFSDHPHWVRVPFILSPLAHTVLWRWFRKWALGWNVWVKILCPHFTALQLWVNCSASLHLSFLINKAGMLLGQVCVKCLEQLSGTKYILSKC